MVYLSLFSYRARIDLPPARSPIPIISMTNCVLGRSIDLRFNNWRYCRHEIPPNLEWLELAGSPGGILSHRLWMRSGPSTTCTLILACCSLQILSSYCHHSLYQCTWWRVLLSYALVCACPMSTMSHIGVSFSEMFLSDFTHRTNVIQSAASNTAAQSVCGI